VERESADGTFREGEPQLPKARPPSPTSTGSSDGRLGATTARPVRTATILIAVIGFLALASYFTTSVIWDGGFPAGEFRVNLRDPEGKPVKGATLRVFRGGTRELAFKYPLDNHLPGQELVSDDTGRIVAIRESGGLQFGGHAWRLFWVIPMGAKAPEFDCEITAQGFAPLTFRVNRLFESPHRYYEDFPKAKVNLGGRDIELPIYEHSFTLKR
jgi:hypothetical protein